VHAVFARRRPVPPAGLPTAWTSALDRFTRSVHRFHDRVEVIPDRQVRAELLAVGAELETSLADLRSRSRVPGAHRGPPAPTVRQLLRSGTLCAHATECAVAAAAASRGRDADETRRCVDDVRAVVGALVGELAAAAHPPAAHPPAALPSP
jgi:hypothetical protein